VEICREYIRKIFLPNLNDLSGFEESADEDAVLLMDDCPNHVGKVIISLLRDIKVRLITPSPHTTQIFQQFDISLFDVPKNEPIQMNFQ
jgi:hypothetical protein